MKKLFAAFFIEATVAAIFITVLLNVIIVSAWGDNGGGRPNYTKAEIDAGALGDKIVFNSISDNSALGAGKDGNEKNFVAAREANGNNGAANVWNADEIKIEDGKEYLIRLYVHNNSPKGYGAVAENTKVSFSIPAISAKTIEVNGFISSSNATPSEYWDHVNFVSDKAFHLDYVYGSALLENNGIGKGAGLKLSDDVVKAASGGTLIGYDALDGKIPGCFQYASGITIKVKAIYDYQYTVRQKIRLNHNQDNDWSDVVEAKVGNKVEFLVEYQNTDTVEHKDVSIKNILPENLAYIEGSANIENSSISDSFIVTNGDISTGSIFGDCKPGESIRITFEAEVTDENLEGGVNSLINWVQVRVGSTIIQEHSAVVLYKKTILYKIIAAILCAILFVSVSCIVKIIKKRRNI